MEELYNPYNDKNSEISKENIKQLFESFNIFYNINYSIRYYDLYSVLDFLKFLLIL